MQLLLLLLLLQDPRIDELEDRVSAIERAREVDALIEEQAKIVRYEMQAAMDAEDLNIKDVIALIAGAATLIGAGKYGIDKMKT